MGYNPQPEFSLRSSDHTAEMAKGSEEGHRERELQNVKGLFFRYDGSREQLGNLTIGSTMWWSLHLNMAASGPRLSAVTLGRSVMNGSTQ